MRRVTRNGVLAAVAVSGAMAVAMPASADSSADGPTADSPGLISGNTIELPVNTPVNLCGNTVNVVGALNPAADTVCTDDGTDAVSGGGADTDAEAAYAPGVGSGNAVRLPVDLPVNADENSVNAVGIGDPATGNESSDDSDDSADDSGEEQAPGLPGHPAPPPAAPGPMAALRNPASLARTGADTTVPAVMGSMAMVLGGAALYRRFRPRRKRRP